MENGPSGSREGRSRKRGYRRLVRGVVVAWTRVVVGEMVMYSGYIL